MICLFIIIYTHAIFACCFYYIIPTSCFPLSSTLWKSLQQSRQRISPFFICCSYSIACLWWRLLTQSPMIAFHSILRIFFLYSVAKNILVYMSLQELLPLNYLQNMAQLTYFGRKNKMCCDFLIKFYLINHPQMNWIFIILYLISHVLLFFNMFLLYLRKDTGPPSTVLSLKSQSSRSLFIII